MWTPYLTATRLLDGRLVEVLTPTAFQSAPVDEDPMTSQHRLWRPTPARGAATTPPVRGGATTPRVLIGMRRLQPMRHRVPQLKTSEFCESCEHRSPPCPLCAAGQ